MTRKEVEWVDDGLELKLWATIQAPSWRLKTDTPTVCPDTIYISPKGWVPCYPAGTGDSCPALAQLLKENDVLPEWITRT